MVMAQPVQHWNLGLGPITCHAWNKDRSQVAVSPNDNTVRILAYQAGKWETVHVLQAHDLPVTAIDWAPNTNRLLTCSHDKNAYVWTLHAGAWKPELVLVRLAMAATCAKWSPQENKFAVGSGARTVAVCYYEKENNWWVAKHIKKPMKSTVSSIDWHPGNALLAVGSCDWRARIFNAWVKDNQESSPQPTPWGNPSKQKFGDVVLDVSNSGGGWVHSVRFSPNGNRLAWVGHDSSLSVCDAEAENKITTVKGNFLPFTCLAWVSDASIVAAGHDCCPMLFNYTGVNQLRFASKLDVPSESKTNKLSAMNVFRNMDKTAAASTDASVGTLHQNRITDLAQHSGGGKAPTSKLSTTSIDGLLAVWDLRTLEQRVQGLKIV